MTAATFMIPVSRYEDLQKKLNRIAVRAAKLGIEPPITATLAHRQILPSPSGREGGGTEVVWMTFRGSPAIIKGWKFIGRYDYADDDLHLLMAPPGTEIPEGMNRGPDTPYCEHCSSARRRNATYLLQQVETGELKIVGSSCLKDFLGLDGIRFAEMFTYNLIDPIEEFFASDDDGWGWMGAASHFNLRVTLAWTSGVVRKFGWVSKSKCEDHQIPTVGMIQMIFSASKGREATMLRKECAPTNEDYAVADRTIEIILSSSANNDYMYKLKVIADSGNDYAPIKHEALWVSAITVYMREVENMAVSQNDAVIENGRRILKGTVKSFKEVFGQFGSQLKMLVIDSQGLKYWGTVPRGRNPRIGETIEVKATIKRSPDDPKFGFFSRPTWAG